MHIKPLNISVRRIGGLLHWRLGRLGGSFYVAHGFQPIGGKNAEKRARVNEQLAAQRYLDSINATMADANAGGW